MPLYYDQPVYRPPSEADSLLIQATLGCGRHHCTYCVSSIHRDFAIRPLAEIKADLTEAHRDAAGAQCLRSSCWPKMPLLCPPLI